MTFGDTVETAGKAADALGVALTLGGVAVALAVAGRRAARRRSRGNIYPDLRRQVGRSILLGLELLVAGDIIRTVAISPSFASVGVLAVIVAVRTFLSFTLEVELTGRWPWQNRRRDDKGAIATASLPKNANDQHRPDPIDHDRISA